jgi:dimethylargininase
VFVEDAAVVVDEVAVITRPGAASRRPENRLRADALAPHRPLRFVSAPGTLDGGDVLRVGRRLWVGLSSRTNAEGARQLRDILAPFGYELATIEVNGCLHLKTAASTIAEDLVLVDPARIDARCFTGLRTIAIHPDEPFAANVLRIDRTLVCSAAARRTQERLIAASLLVRPLDRCGARQARGGRDLLQSVAHPLSDSIERTRFVLERVLSGIVPPAISSAIPTRTRLTARRPSVIRRLGMRFAPPPRR